MKRRRWFEIHSWLGVMTGLLLFVICWSGTVAVLTHEIDWLLNPALRVTPQQERVSWGKIEAAVRRAYPDAQGVSLNAPPYANFAAEVRLDTPVQKNLRVYVDPYTAQVTGVSSFFNVQRFFRSFHMSLFNLWGIGYWIISAFGFFLLASLLAPLWFYRRWWQRFFKLEMSRGARVVWSDAHKLAGLWGGWFVLLMALTGAWWTFEYADVTLGYPNTEPPASSVEAPPLPLDTLMAAAHQAWPALAIGSISLPDDPGSGALSLIGQNEAWLVRDRANRLYLDPGTGAVLAQQSAQRLGWPARWIDTVDPLHFGNFAGFWVKLIWFVFGLGLSGLCLSGIYLHSRRLAAQAGGRQRARWRGTAIALLITAAVLLGSVRPGWIEIKGYGAAIKGVQQWPEVAGAVTVFIVGWIVFTLLLLALCTGWLKRPRRTLPPACSGARRLASHEVV